MDHHRHTQAVFIAVSPSCHCACGHEAQWGWFLPTGRVGAVYCRACAPEDMVTRAQHWATLPKEGCIYCDNPSRPVQP